MVGERRREPPRRIILPFGLNLTYTLVTVRQSVQIEQMVREFRDSGLTGRQFCLREGLSPSMLVRYLRGTATGESGGGNGLVVTGSNARHSTECP